MAAVLVLLGLVLGVVAEGEPLRSVLGWLLSGFGAISALAWFTVADSRRRADPWYSASAGPALARAALVGLAVLVVALNAYRFADWWSRQ